MAQNAPTQSYQRLHLTPIDLGVALVVVIALLAALALRAQVEGQATAFQSADVPIQFSYPATWREVGTLQDVLLNIEDPYVDSAQKSQLSIETRQLEPSSAPPIEELVNRTIDERSTLTGYHFLGSNSATVGGATATQIDFAYVTQPIDEPRRPSLPVVVLAREYVVVAGDRSYYITMIAPQEAADGAFATLDRVLASVRL